jgi:ribosome-associated protein
MEKFPRKALHREGHAERRWVILDYGEIVVHVFQRETRAFYDIESLWADRIVETEALS